MVLCFPRASRSSRLPFIVPSVTAACFWLVVLCFFADCRPSEATTYFIVLFFCHLIRRPQTIAKRSPTRFTAVTHPPQYLPHSKRQLLVGCCVFPTKRRPPKAENPPPSLFFDGLHFSTQNKGTNCGAAKPDGARLAWAHRERRRHELVAPLAYPWRERAKAAGG